MRKKKNIPRLKALPMVAFVDIGGK